MKYLQVICVFTLCVIVCWGAIIEPSDESKANINREGRILGNPSRTLFYADPYGLVAPRFDFLSAAIPAVLLGGIAALTAHAFGAFNVGSSAAAASPAAEAPVANQAEEAVTQAVESAQETLNASQDDELRAKLDKIRIRGGYNGNSQGIKVNKHGSQGQRFTPIRDNDSPKNKHSSSLSSSGSRYHEYSSKRRFHTDSSGYNLR